MDNMNFLHKKYTSSFSQALSHSRSSRSFLPPHASNLIKQVPSHPHSLAHTQIHNTSPQQNMVNNHCPTHPQELIRHMCTDCIQLLCSQCIGEHIAIHKEGNSFPTISSLKQLRQQMNMKLNQISQYMMLQENHPKCIDVDGIRKESNFRIDEIRKDMLMVVEEWILRLRNSVVNNVGYEELSMIKKQMNLLQDEVHALNNSLANANMSVQSIKKAYQIDAEKLYKSYQKMVDKYSNIKGNLEIDIQINQSKFIEALESCVTIKAGQKQLIKLDKEDMCQQEKSKEQEIDFPLQLHSPYHEIAEPLTQQQKQCLGLFELLPGSSILSRQVFQANHQISKIQTYNVNLKTYPLNSQCLLPDNMIVISGGMISEQKKNQIVQIYDFHGEIVISQTEFYKGRSSHSTIPYKDKILFVGGFIDEGQCQYLQILTGDGMVKSQKLYQWGGPNLCIITGDGLLKITLSGVQIMNLDTLEWVQLKSDVPFSIRKGLSLEYLPERNIVCIFGDGQEYYEWDCENNKMTMKKSNICLGNIKSSTVCGNCIYCWDEDKNILMFNSKEWRMMSNNK